MLLIPLLCNPFGNKHHQQYKTPSTQHQKRNAQKQVPISHIIRLPNKDALLSKCAIKGILKQEGVSFGRHLWINDAEEFKKVLPRRGTVPD